MPMGELQPVTMTTLPATRLAVLGGATCRMRGMDSKVPSEGMPWVSCWERAWRRRLARAPDMVGGGGGRGR